MLMMVMIIATILPPPPKELKMYSLMMTANGHVDPHGTLAPPIIMRTAATPMPTPKSSLGTESILAEELIFREGVPRYGEVGFGFPEAGIGHGESRRGSSTSMDPLAFDQRSQVSDVHIHPLRNQHSIFIIQLPYVRRAPWLMVC